MARAIVLPLMQAGGINPNNVIGVVGNHGSINSALDQLPKGVTVVSSDDPRAKDAWNCSTKILAIKPQLFDSQSLLNFRVRESTASSSLLISILAGVTLKKLQKKFPEYSCVRAVPNTPIQVGAGLTGLSCGTNLTEDQRILVENIFKPISEVFYLPEDQLDAFLALTSSGPAYIALIVEALTDGAVAAGLSRSLASQLACKTLSGSSLLLQKKKLHPGQLKDIVTSPGGTTITALRHLEMAGVRSALMEAVIAAAERSRELG